jgi:hypothetical protein
MATLAIKSGTTAIAGSTVKGSFSYFSGSTQDLGPTSSTGFYSGVDAPTGGYTIYQIGGSGGWTARVATDTTSLNSILISAGGTGSTVDQNITWATNTNSVFINSGATPTYTIGQSALGGIIAYINGGGSTGTSGLVVSSSSTLGTSVWGCYLANINTSTNAGTGAANTAAILSDCAARPIAASVAAAHTGGGYTDWYLPSVDDLNRIYVNRVAIGNWGSSYWSSSQFNSQNSYFYDSNYNIENKNTPLNVRAVRSF